jgi:peptidoglycan/LPS O-acetylase OafA/YrhL
MAEGTNAGRGRIPALDGVRGIAILWVMLHHFSRLDPGGAAVDRVYAQLAATGRIGVDLFFVLSGFLITRILVDTRGSAGYFRAFYGRRLLRIVPVYYVAILLALTLLPRLLGPDAPVAGLGERQGWFWLYGVNYLIAREGWEAAAGMEHFWSLAVEEQFYLVWPLVVAAVSAPALLALSLAGVAAAPLLRGWTLLAGGGYEDLYVAAHLRFDGFLVGAAISVALRRFGDPARLRPWAAAVVGAGVVGKAAIVAGGWGWPGGTAASALLATATSLWSGGVVLLAITAAPYGAVSRLLRSRPLRAAGKYSYALYVFHIAARDLLLRAGVMPERVPALAGSGLPGQFVFNVAAGAASLSIAYASWHLLEKHCLALKRYFPYGSGKRHTRRAAEPAGERRPVEANAPGADGDACSTRPASAPAATPRPWRGRTGSAARSA